MMLRVIKLECIQNDEYDVILFKLYSLAPPRTTPLKDIEIDAYVI